MTSATLNLRIAPRRMLSQREAAEYCGLPVKTFAALSGVRPVGLPGGRVAWDIQDLDRMIDARKGGVGAADDDILDRLD